MIPAEAATHTALLLSTGHPELDAVLSLLLVAGVLAGGLLVMGNLPSASPGEGQPDNGGVDGRGDPVQTFAATCTAFQLDTVYQLDCVDAISAVDQSVAADLSQSSSNESIDIDWMDDWPMNPTTGLSMLGGRGGLDIGGNPYGSDGLEHLWPASPFDAEDPSSIESHPIGDWAASLSSALSDE